MAWPLTAPPPSQSYPPRLKLSSLEMHCLDA
eukprot:CAMPEP_0119384200 /NCGR_PEP_ID=MMETSP1334-20130426/84168_1 /TAXON_ID=127549 /ORGANISM="Calcidiscus leptoporus, Strain RCC1130" /LENGTH=30 /DNA_ID= /DNA_START= /DNA_END= /DNA_ORIENTATION=